MAGTGEAAGEKWQYGQSFRSESLQAKDTALSANRGASFRPLSAVIAQP